MKLMAIDPGKTTGIAYWDGKDFASTELAGGLNAAVNFLKAHHSEVDVVIYEKFEIHSSTIKTDMTDAYTALYINGNIISWAALEMIQLVEQRPKDKLFSSAGDWRTLRAVGWYTPLGDGHANDAAAHLLKYMVDKRILPDNLFNKIIDAELGL